MLSVIKNRRFWLMCAGYAIFLSAWYGSVNWLPIAAFSRLPDPVGVAIEWLDPDPYSGISIFTQTYYTHILYSTYRAFTAFFLAVALGVPLGVLMGWNRKFDQYVSALLAILRPIPPLAWVPLAILLFWTMEMAVIFVTFLVAFYATAMNTYVGVRAIDKDYFRAAASLGAKPRHVLRDVIIPGCLPNMFTGLQIAMGAAWFSLVAGEMIASQHGLGYLIFDAYSVIQFDVIIIGMATLGIVGYTSSMLIRVLGNYLMRWRAQSIGGVK